MMRRILEDALGRSVVKNRQPLTFEFVPKELPHREEQFRQLSAIFAGLVGDGLAAHARFKPAPGGGQPGEPHRHWRPVSERRRGGAGVPR